MELGGASARLGFFSSYMVTGLLPRSTGEAKYLQLHQHKRGWVKAGHVL